MTEALPDKLIPGDPATDSQREVYIDGWNDAIDACERALEAKGAPEPVYQLRARFSQDWLETPGAEIGDGFGRWYEVTREIYERCAHDDDHKGRILYAAPQAAIGAEPALTKLEQRRLGLYSELAEALGTDCLDSHESRLDRARRASAALSHRSTPTSSFSSEPSASGGKPGAADDVGE